MTALRTPIIHDTVAPCFAAPPDLLHLPTCQNGRQNNLHSRRWRSNVGRVRASASKTRPETPIPMHGSTFIHMRSLKRWPVPLSAWLLTSDTSDDRDRTACRGVRPMARIGSAAISLEFGAGRSGMGARSRRQLDGDESALIRALNESALIRQASSMFWISQSAGIAWKKDTGDGNSRHPEGWGMEIAQSDAFAAARLPGSEDGGVADARLPERHRTA